MHQASDLQLYHAPNSRSLGTLTLLEELGVPFSLELVDIRADAQHTAAFRAINPMGKVPALVHRGVAITEQVAIMLYLADRFAEAGLAPALDDPLRGPYLRWMVFYAASLEPAVTDKALGRAPGDRAMMPYGDFDTTIATVIAQLSRGPWMLGERFTAADVLWGNSLTWLTGWKLVPAAPAILAFVERFNARPAVIRAKARDAGLAAPPPAS